MLRSALGRAVRETGAALDRSGLALLRSRLADEHFTQHRTRVNLDGKEPKVADDAFVAPCATVAGDVKIGEGSSVWYAAVVKGDFSSVSIGRDTNVQDGAIIHTRPWGVVGEGRKEELPAKIGDRVTIGHGASLYSCVVEDESLVGMSAICLQGSVMEKNSMLAAGAVLPEGSRVPSGELWAGSPARFARKLTDKEFALLRGSAEHYVDVAGEHAAAVKAVTSPAAAVLP
eukprot:PLAT7136.1.p1 GENE.PLAT7136.1~~PLAT7136.1.p1  ORF type:complete len:254 (-),score=101.02 PLAT7136.1:155-844(-)